MIRRVAFQGERGAFSELAIAALTGNRTRPIPCPQFSAVFASLASGKADAAVIPIENTLHGSVHENYDHLLQFDGQITGETHIRISHSLIAPEGVRLANIKRVFSHPVALNQCRSFFAAHPGLQAVSHYDTAGSVKTVVQERSGDAAAIAASAAAAIYGARILKRSIEDDPANFTRFFLLRPASARARPLKAADWKTSLVFTTNNTPGALFRCLSAFALRDLSLTKIESRPLRGKPWEYLFYLDFLGRADDPKCRKALDHLGEATSFLRVLGSYPKGEFPA